MVKGLNGIPGVSCVPPKGTFYAFANVKELGIPVDEMVDRMMEEVGLVAIPGTAFGDDGEGFLRFSFAVSDSEIADGLERLETFARKIRA
ncbi:MAG: aminotransferase class I/II-fold pyridoxal phosphate-dependent enzyme [Blautia sp.]